MAGGTGLSRRPIPGLTKRLELMNEIQAHRGPDGHATCAHGRGAVGFAHRRLTIIDLATGDQPMRDEAGNWISYNGEISNDIELRAELGDPRFLTPSATEVALR